MSDTIENPTEEGLSHRRTPAPRTLVIFRPTGNLTHNKPIPAQYATMMRHLPPPTSGAVGMDA